MGDTSLCIIGQRNINGSQNNRDHFHCSYLPLRTRRYKTQDPIAEGPHGLDMGHEGMKLKLNRKLNLLTSIQSARGVGQLLEGRVPASLTLLRILLIIS